MILHLFRPEYVDYIHLIQDRQSTCRRMLSENRAFAFLLQHHKYINDLI